MLIHFELPTDFETVMNRTPRRVVSNRVPVDVMENQHGTTVYAELPGVRKEDVQITFEEEVLTITGKRQEREIPNDARVLLHEQRVRDFERSLMIGHPVNQEAMTARLENGLLTVELPKAEIAKPKTIDIR